MLWQNDFKILIKSTSNQNLKKTLTLLYHIGLRSVECAKLEFKDIKSNDISIIDSRGKRSCFIPAETDFRAIQRKGIRKNLSHLESLQDMKILPQRKIF